MSGTVIGGKKAAEKNISNYGADFYARIGAMGGKKGKTGGFFANRELARIAGAKGGRKSKRKPWSPEQRAENAARKVHKEQFNEAWPQVKERIG